MKNFLTFSIFCAFIAGFQCTPALNGENFQSLFQEHEEGQKNFLQGHKMDFKHPDIYLDVPELIVKYGYPVESHEITTEDGYILTAHRIPHGKDSGPSDEPKPVIWLQHGLMDSSAGWILNSVEKCFAYKLADAGYDVWLGNARGNKYSKRHVSMTEKDKEFWNFSWNEMGKYDVPAVLNYILEKTGEEKIFYVGHSMGSTMFIIAMSEHPELNDKIRLMVGVGPAIYVHNMVSPMRLLAPFWDSIDWITDMMGMHEFLPSGPLMDFLGATLCKETSLFQPICSNILFIAMGYNFDQLNATMLPIILGHAPAGASTNSVIHYAQSVRHQDFRKWDYGKKGNLEVYGVDPPPQYDLSKVTAPVAIYWGQNDWLVQEPDVYRFANAMPNLVKIQRVNHDKWNHVDFVWGIDADTLLYNPIMEFMKRF